MAVSQAAECQKVSRGMTPCQMVRKGFFAAKKSESQMPLWQPAPGCLALSPSEANLFSPACLRMDSPGTSPRLATVEQAVVVGERHDHDGADLDLAVHHPCLVLDGVHAQDGRTGQVEDGRAKERAKDAAVADGERAAAHVLERELVVARPSCPSTRDGLLDLDERHAPQGCAPRASPVPCPSTRPPTDPHSRGTRSCRPGQPPSMLAFAAGTSLSAMADALANAT
ncbi:hypothetical protein L1887_49533 [Cichorium endivia]|nr:hypothetical protein L1887_49533 [Cichorium endivia]